MLGRDPAESAQWKNIRANLAPYPAIDGPHGRVWLDIENAPAEYVYNVPATITPVYTFTSKTRGPKRTHR